LESIWNGKKYWNDLMITSCTYLLFSKCFPNSFPSFSKAFCWKNNYSSWKK
jgi:hypothetical protein